MQNRLHYLKQALKNAYYAVNPPKIILVYQMGKVGSSSIYRAIPKNLGTKTFHVHYLNMEPLLEIGAMDTVQTEGGHIDNGLRIRYTILNTDLPIKIITVVRDPISRNISAFFENLENFAHNPTNADIDDLINHFIENYSHSVPLNWFDDEFAKSTGVNVFQHNFDQHKGYTRLAQGRFDILIIKVELDDEIKSKLVEQFVGIRNISIQQINQGSEKAYREQYNMFKQKINLSEEYIDWMLDSKYAQHFYSDTERHEIRKRWLYF